MRHGPAGVALAFFLLPGAFAPGASAQELAIDFDTDPAGSPLIAGQVVNDVYASLGVTFERTGSNESCPGPDVYASSDHPGDFGSLPFVVTTCPEGIASDISESNYGRVQAHFAFDTEEVCIAVRPDDPGETGDSGVLRAFDAGGAPLGEVVSIPGMRETLCIQADGIRSVHFSGHESRFARFDDLKVMAPEPASRALSVVALLGLARLASRSPPGSRTASGRPARCGRTGVRASGARERR